MSEPSLDQYRAMTSDVSAAEPVGGERACDLAMLLGMASGHKWLILLPAIIGAVLAAIIGFSQASVYTSTLRIVIDPREREAVNIKSVMNERPLDLEGVSSEIEILQSGNLALDTIRRANLLNEPEFVPALAGDDTVTAFFKDKLAALLGRPGVAQPAADQEAAVLERYFERLSVRALGQSRLVEIAFTSESPELAQRVARTLAEAYLEQRQEQRLAITRKATEWLHNRVRALRADVQAAEDAVERERQALGRAQGRDADALSERVSAVIAQVEQARSDHAQAQARLRNAETALERGGATAALPYVDERSILSQLRVDEAAAQKREAELLTVFGPRHPDVLQSREELARITARMESAADTVLAELRDAAQTAADRRQALEAALVQLQAEGAREGLASMPLRALEREAEAQRVVFETMLNRAREVEQSTFYVANAWIASAANLPVIPSGPRRKLMLVVGVVLGLVAGVAAAFAREQMENRVRSPHDLGLTPTEVIAHIPRLAARDARHNLHGYALAQPQSGYSETVQRLNTSVLLGDASGAEPQVILFTSAVPGEGKTSLTAASAMMMHESGRRTVVIDADFRRPRLNRLFGLPLGPGLAEVLAGQATLEEALREDPRSGLVVLTTGAGVRYPAHLLTADRLLPVLSALRQQFASVLIDGPPVLPVVDARILANWTDCCLLVVKWGSTPIEAVRNASHILRKTGHPVGVVFNQVDSRHARHYAPDVYGMLPDFEKTYWRQGNQVKE